MRRDVLFVLVIGGCLSLAPVVASLAHSAEATLNLAQAPPPRRDFDPGESRSSDSLRCRQAKEDVKVLDGRLKDPEFEDIPTRAEYNLGSAWESEGRGAILSSPSERFSLAANTRQRTLDVWGENSRQFREGEAANAKYKDFNRRAPRAFSKPAMPSREPGESLDDYNRRMEEWRKTPSVTYGTPESERLWKLFHQRIKIQDTRRATYDAMLRTCYPGAGSNPLQDLEDRVRKLENETPR
jgi:hypothetical protein